MKVKIPGNNNKDRVHPNSSLDMYKGSVPLASSGGFSAHNISAISHMNQSLNNTSSHMIMPDTFTMRGRSSIQPDQSFDIVAGQSIKKIKNDSQAAIISQNENNQGSLSTIWAQQPSAARYVHGKQVRSLASLSTEKMYKQTFPINDDYEQYEQLVEEFKPSVSNFKMPQLNDQYRSLIT